MLAFFSILYIVVIATYDQIRCPRNLYFHDQCLKIAMNYIKYKQCNNTCYSKEQCIVPTLKYNAQYAKLQCIATIVNYRQAMHRIR